MLDYSKYADRDLVSLLKRGDQTAYAEIYNRYKRVLQSHAYKKLGDFEEVKDVLQDVFTILWNRREHLPDTTNLSGYLYTIVRNRVFNVLAHKSVTAKYVDSLQRYIDEGQYDTDRLVAEREFEQEIEKEIGALPPKMREIFTLSRKSALSHKEIAEQLSLSEQTVSKQVSNALKILRKKLSFFFGLLMTYLVVLACYFWLD